MRKVITVALFAAAGLILPAHAQQAGDFYVQGSVGSSWGQSSLGQSGIWELSAGRHMTRNIRLELAIDWRDGYRFDVDGDAAAFGNTDVDSASYMANVYWDFYEPRGRARGLIPYLGIGAGLAQHETRNVVLRTETGPAITAQGNNADRFGWQLMGGMTLETGDFSFARFGYRYLDHGTARLSISDGPLTRRVQAHELSATLGFRF
ncbi:outer membrane protein [Indioceanicola profundi]|uniref:outer membrane protein n=1 Tax=Indioceanicola profundi TaxID=2220096 RepID=UPI000E6AB51D|nr:outer membrane beta-barrel protein [Indioceanicola profundi]